MLKKMSATDAKSKLGSILDWVGSGDDAVVIQRHGRPEAVVIGYERYQMMVAVLQKDRTKKTWRDLQRRAAEIRERNKDLSEDTIDTLAEEISRETVARLIAEQKAKSQTG